MKKIDNLHIENFRGVDRVKFQTKTINIIVGKNNTGKSSILQALSLILSITNSFKDSLGMKFLNYFMTKKEYKLEFLIKNGSKSKIEYNHSNKNVRLDIEYFKSGLPDDSRRKYILRYLNESKSNFIDRYLVDSFEDYSVNISRLMRNFEKIRRPENEEKREFPTVREDIDDFIRRSLLSKASKDIELVLDKFIAKEKLVLSLFKSNQLTTIYLIPGFQFKRYLGYRKGYVFGSDYYSEIEIGEMSPRAEKKGMENKIIFDFSKRITIKEVNRLHDQVIKQKKTIKALDIIKEALPYFEDIRKTDEGLFISVTGKEVPLPLSSMGDGFVALLKLSFMITLAENGIIILEEPEASQHPGFLELLAENIILNTTKSQFFISTHSLDLINLILKHGERNNCLGEINIIRLHSGLDNELDVEILSGKQAKEEVDQISTDLRGY